MYIYSEKTKKKYETVQECEADEKAFDEAVAKEKAKKERIASEKNVRLKAVEDAYQKAIDAKKEYNDLMSAYVKDYGSISVSTRRSDFNPFGFFNLFF